ncbi:MAG: hypothetical protein L6V93_15730 [Clostridiales bacterium]|nr:MAG: hypothetical protein L6V93_15730 [Clostridiales bacterium]
MNWKCLKRSARTTLKTCLKLCLFITLQRGVTQKFVRDTVKKTRLTNSICFYDIFDDFTRERYSLCSLDFALRQMHFPSDFETLAKARERLVFEELFILQLSLLYIRKNREQKTTERVRDISYKEEFEKTLPFTLTGAQQNVLNEVLCDLQSEKCANRLIQGDVGSGKKPSSPPRQCTSARKKRFSVGTYGAHRNSGGSALRNAQKCLTDVLTSAF